MLRAASLRGAGSGPGGMSAPVPSAVLSLPVLLPDPTAPTSFEHHPGLTGREAEALELAERIAANAPLAVRYSKSVMKQAAEVSEAEGWKINAEAVGVVFTSADAMEGPVAFAEKRPPNWQGK